MGMGTFDFEAYKHQCLAIAHAYQAWSKGDLNDQAYETVIAKSAMVGGNAIAKIEREIILKGGQFRPIDAYQF